MKVRRAEERDIPRIAELLLRVAKVHADGRPDLFRAGQRKYTDEELKAILRDPAPRCRRKTAFLFALRRFECFSPFFVHFHAAKTRRSAHRDVRPFRSRRGRVKKADFPPRNACQTEEDKI